MRSVQVACRVVLGLLAAGCVAGIVGVHAESPGRATGPLTWFSGRVTYQFSRPGLTGSSTFDWTDHGYRYRQELASKALSEQVLGRGRSLWMLRAKSREAQRASVHPGDLWMNSAWMPYVTPARGAGERVGEGTVLGKPCEIRKIHQMRVWFWEGLPLRMEREPGSKLMPVTLVATRLEAAVHPPAHFDLPPGYRAGEFPGPKNKKRLLLKGAATAGLGVMLLALGVVLWVVESAFARSRAASRGREA